MLSAAMLEKLNAQVANELYASNVYLSMSAWLDGRNLRGMGAWMRIQSEEERKHALRILDYILDRGGEVRMATIPQPPVAFTSPLNVFEDALHHERGVTRSIHDLYALAQEERDFASKVFLDWFVNEQVEEEKSGELAVAQLTMAGDDRSALLMLDREFGQRQPEAGGGAEG